MPEGRESASVKAVVPFDYADMESLIKQADARPIGFVVNIHEEKPSGLPVTDQT